jgi:hypothetical protein
MVAVGDATWTHGSWMLVIRDPHAKENVYERELFSETTASYQIARRELAARGITFTAFVGDGRVATPFVFSDIPVQMCHFHQMQIVIRPSASFSFLKEPSSELVVFGICKSG